MNVEGRIGLAPSTGEYNESKKVQSTTLFLRANGGVVAADSGVPEPKKTRKEKEVFEIDFFSAEDPDEDALFTTGGASINLPKTQWKSKSRNLLPDDMHFNSKQLLRLFLKPKAMLHSKKSGGANAVRGVGGTDGVPDDVDERYWAEAAQRNKIVTSSTPHLNAFLIVAPEPEAHAGYDADFFADNDTGGFGDGGFGDDGETFADAREQFLPGASRVAGVGDTSQSDEFGSLLRARRARPDYVNYAKTAKKVDVKRLKDNLWAKLDIPEVTPPSKHALSPVSC
jgi:condensin complex subunit 2